MIGFTFLSATHELLPPRVVGATIGGRLNEKLFNAVSTSNSHNAPSLLGRVLEGQYTESSV